MKLRSTDLSVYVLTYQKDHPSKSDRRNGNPGKKKNKLCILYLSSLSLSLSLSLSIYLSLSLSLYLSIYLSIYLFLSLSSFFFSLFYLSFCPTPSLSPTSFFSFFPCVCESVRVCATVFSYVPIPTHCSISVPTLHIVDKVTSTSRVMRRRVKKAGEKWGVGVKTHFIRPPVIILVVYAYLHRPPHHPAPRLHTYLPKNTTPPVF
ncbi:unnamed protein product [Acanthosepion pharaonis]|uniref:Uncharacterized protein n=1 Tax=Acanthosepion pharaonis TaxID=158019 RepID=A0A812E4V0_ACAPH|nr:unnamed protein product [Sepia pharaonis]